MSFILNDSKKNALAIVKGGEFKNKYLHIRNNNNFSISDIPNNYIDNLNNNEKDILNNSIKEKLQPKEEKLENTYYELMNYLKEKKKKDFILRKGGKFEVLPIKKGNLTEKLYICGVSGAGKSTYASNYIKNI
jgi:ABC-type oligopeptide transport system ATPase subunit